VSIRRSILASVAGRYAGMVIQLLGSLILARLIAPAEFGVYGVAVAVVALSGAIREFGVSNYLIQLPELDRSTIARAFGMVLSMSIVFAATLLLLRGWIAELYGEPRLAQLIGLSIIGFILMPFSLSSVVSLQRELRFATLTTVALLSTVVGLGCTMLLALQGWGAFSLMWGQLAISAATVVMFGLMRPREIAVMPRFDGWGAMLGFGLYSMLTNLAYQFGTSVLALLIGRNLGFTAVGLFDRATGTIAYLSRDLLGTIMGVVYVGLSRAKLNPSHMAWLAQAAMAHVTGMMVPAYALVAVLADPLVLTLFGSAWSDAVPLVRALAIAAAFSCVASVHARALVALARTRDQCILEWTLQAIRLGGIAMIIHQGLLAVAWVQIGIGAMTMLGYIGLTYRAVGVTISAMFISTGLALVLAAAAALPAYLIQMYFEAALGKLGVLLVGGSAGGLCWCLAVFALRHPTAGEIRRAWSRVREALRTGPGRAG